MTKIYLIRHAEAEGNLYRMAHGHYNGMITNYRGYQQIDALRQRFQDVDIDAVYASDLYRTQITSRAIWLPKALPLHLEPAFREIHMGVWENHTWHELNKAYPQEMYHFNRRVDLWHVEGGETAQDVLDRYLPALHRVGAAHDGGTVAVFSHGAALRIVLGTLQGVPLSGIGETPHGDNTAVSLLTWDNGQLRVEYRDDNSHLTERGLSTFAKQSWWRSKNMVDPGEDYLPLPEELLPRFHVPDGGEAVGIRSGETFIGAYQLLPDREPDAVWLGWYWLDPAFRGTGRGIAPMGQIIRAGRHREVGFLRLSCGDAKLRRFFARLGFYPLSGDVMEKDIRQQLPPIPQAYRP